MAIMGNTSSKIKPSDIINQLQRRDKPVMTTGDLANALGVSVQTVRNHIQEAERYDKVRKTEVAGTTAYWLDESPTAPDHRCHRCKRDIKRTYDHARIDMKAMFSNVKPYDVPSFDYYVVCRFCYSDLISWLWADENTMYEYPFIDDWDIPQHQLDEVKADPDIKTEYIPPDEELPANQPEN